MPKRSYRLASDSPEIEAAFTELRRQLKVSLDFPDDVLVDAERAALTATPREGRDRTPVRHPLTLDSMDLDQAFHIERDGDEYRVRYAIADVAAFVEPGGPMDVEAHERGETLYAPDENVRLYPTVLSEGAASLLPDETRPAVIWTMDVDATGEEARSIGPVTRAESREARLRERAAGARRWDGFEGQLRLLREVGILRLQREERRGGVSLPLPERITEVNGEYGLRFRAPLPVEGWNAQISR